jgi:hypothetical protein
VGFHLKVIIQETWSSKHPLNAMGKDMNLTLELEMGLSLDIGFSNYEVYSL